MVLEPGGKAALVGCLHGSQTIKEARVVERGEKPLKLVGVRLPSLADARADELGELGVALDEPAPEGDAVRLVVELLRIDLVEGRELGVLEDARVQGRDAVHGVAEVDVDVCHVDIVPLVDDLDERLVVGRAHALVELADDGHELGYRTLEIG